MIVSETGEKDFPLAMAWVSMEGRWRLADSNLGEYWEARLRDMFDLRGVGHKILSRSYNRWLYRVRKHVFLRVVKTYISRLPASPLDIGAGTGFYIDLWKQLGVRSVTGVDITSIVVERLSRKYPEAEFYQLDIGGDLKILQNRQFDVITAFDVLFHIVDDEKYHQAFLNIATLLKSGGLFIFSDNFIHGRTLHATHQVSRSLEQIEAEVQSAGLEILGRAPMFILMATPVDTTSKLLKFSWNLIYLLSIFEIPGFILGALLYPCELIALQMVKEGPSTEIMICRKKLAP